jgi:hypothetical protein
MGLFDFKKKASSPVSESETTGQMLAFDKLAEIFLSSPILQSTGMGRCEKMASAILSYKCIFAYLFEHEFKFGEASNFIKENEKIRYILTSQGLTQSESRKGILLNLPSNWQDILKTISILRMAEPDKISQIQDDIDGITKTINILSQR